MPAEFASLLKIYLAIWKIILPYLLALKAFILQFWLFPLPFIIVKYKWGLKWWYLNYIHDQFDMKSSNKRIVLEVKIPQTNVRPIKAMENVFNSYFGSWDPPSDWKAFHFDGKKILGTSFEIVGIDGVPHFYIRVPAGNRKLLESSIYAQYPDVEIVEVPDYTKAVPPNMPNAEWDLWGTDFVFTTEKDYFPIKTYEQFYEPVPESMKEEKRIDPLSSLFETMSKLGPGEQMWIQIWMMPIGPAGSRTKHIKEIATSAGIIEKGKKEIDKRVKRPEKKDNKNPLIRELWEYLWHFLVHGTTPPAAAKEEKSLLPPEMMLTAGERDVVVAIEKKINKNLYTGFIKYIYLAKKKVFFNGAKGFATSFFSQFNVKELNSLKPLTESTTKVQSPEFFRERKLYVKKRDLFVRYCNRDNAFAGFGSKISDGVTMNVEELATIYHFPGLEAVPSAAIKRIQTKKAAPPADLPIG